MPILKLTDDQLLTLRAGWQFFDDNKDEVVSDVAEALGITEEERGVNEDGEYEEGKDESTDKLLQTIAEVTMLVMQD